jgi:hypothetical protein
MKYLISPPPVKAIVSDRVEAIRPCLVGFQPAEWKI